LCGVDVQVTRSGRFFWLFIPLFDVDDQEIGTWHIKASKQLSVQIVVKAIHHIGIGHGADGQGTQ
jgi:hypothetical protein